MRLRSPALNVLKFRRFTSALFRQVQGVFYADIRVFFRSIGVLIFVMFIPLMLSTMLYLAGSALRGSLAPLNMWYWQFLGVLVLALSMITSSDIAWFVRRMMINGMLEYYLAAPINPLAPIIAVMMSRMLVVGTILLASGLVATIAIFGLWRSLAYVVGVLLAILGIVPLLGIGLILSALVIKMREPQTLVSLVQGLYAMFSGTVYPITMLPHYLRWISSLLPQYHVVEMLRGMVLGLVLPLNHLLTLLLLLAYLALGMITYALIEEDVRRRGSYVGW